MKLIPVIDLVDGRAVWARRGQRDRYRPLATPLCPDGDPVRLAARFSAEYGADTLYIADLDAIRSRGDNQRQVRAIAAVLPQLELWVDAGLSDRDSLCRFADLSPARLVIGSETLADSRLLTLPEARSAVLSLDYRGTRLLGPADLAHRLQDWPNDLILMALERVGSGEGPELDLLAKLRHRLPRCRLFSAGGVRDPADLLRLQASGAAGALLASALHEGRISTADAEKLK